MKLKDSLKSDLGSVLVKTLTTAVLGGLFGAHEADDSSTSAASSAWKEIEHKLHGLFGSEDEKGKQEHQSQHLMKILAIVAALVVVSYLLGRRQGRGRTTILEVHKA